jgi:hypothetical protein
VRIGSGIFQPGESPCRTPHDQPSDLVQNLAICHHWNENLPRFVGLGNRSVGGATCPIERNTAERLWTVPAERMKGGREHRVPLNKT